MSAQLLISSFSQNATPRSEFSLSELNLETQTALNLKELVVSSSVKHISCREEFSSSVLPHRSTTTSANRRGAPVVLPPLLFPSLSANTKRRLIQSALSQTSTDSCSCSAHTSSDNVGHTSIPVGQSENMVSKDLQCSGTNDVTSVSPDLTEGVTRTTSRIFLDNNDQIIDDVNINSNEKSSCDLSEDDNECSVGLAGIEQDNGATCNIKHKSDQVSPRRFKKQKRKSGRRYSKKSSRKKEKKGENVTENNISNNSNLQSLQETANLLHTQSLRIYSQDDRRSVNRNSVLPSKQSDFKSRLDRSRLIYMNNCKTTPANNNGSVKSFSLDQSKCSGIDEARTDVFVAFKSTTGGDPSRVIKIYQSERQSGVISDSGVDFPCAPPSTPMPDHLKKYQYVPSLTDNKAQRAVKSKLHALDKAAQQKEQKRREDKVRMEKIYLKDRKKKKVPTATLR